MIDTNIAVDLLERDPDWYRWSLEAVVRGGHETRLAASAVVVAELAGEMPALPELLAFLSAFDVSVQELGPAAGHRAGRAQADYRKAGGKREKLLGDFLIGAHAETAGARLLTRDPRRYRAYFPELDLITPEDDNG